MVNMNKLLRQAVNDAVRDRESLACAFGEDTPEGINALKDAERVKAISGVDWHKMNADQREMVRCVLLWAEQDRIDIDPKLAALYRQERVRRWGKTYLEGLDADPATQTFNVMSAKGLRGMIDELHAQ